MGQFFHGSFPDTPQVSKSIPLPTPAKNPPATPVATPQFNLFPANLIPQTANKTAGNTPYPTMENLVKRKIDKMVNVSQLKKAPKLRKIQSFVNRSKMNKLFYELLPDGWIVVYASKGSADGEPGFLQPVVKSLEKDLVHPF